MPATKASKILLVSQALAAAASVNATEWNMSAAYAGRGFVRITNGAVAPTTAPVVKFFSGEATGIKRLLYTASGDTVANSVNDIPCSYDLADMFANITIINGATNAVTVEAYGQEASGL